MKEKTPCEQCLILGMCRNLINNKWYSIEDLKCNYVENFIGKREKNLKRSERYHSRLLLIRRILVP